MPTNRRGFGAVFVPSRRPLDGCNYHREGPRMSSKCAARAPRQERPPTAAPPTRLPSQQYRWGTTTTPSGDKGAGSPRITRVPVCPTEERPRAHTSMPSRPREALISFTLPVISDSFSRAVRPKTASTKICIAMRRREEGGTTGARGPGCAGGARVTRTAATTRHEPRPVCCREGSWGV